VFCWNARRQFADSIDARLGALAGRRLEAHLAACVRCSGEYDALTAVAQAVGDAARPDAIRPPADFEARLFAAIRSRHPAPAPAFALPATFPLAASIVLMVAAALIAALAVGPGDSALLSPPAVSSPPVSGLRAEPGDDPSADRLAPPEEIPFTLHEDLVGTRRGRIPSTTYVLEPAPEERPVMRASL